MGLFGVRLTGRADKGGSRKSSHGYTTLFILPHIGEGTSDKSHGRRESNTAEGSAY